MTDAVSYFIRSMESELQHFDQVVDQTTVKRDQLASQLFDLTQRVKLSDDDLKDPQAVSAAMSLMSSAMKVMNDQEQTAARRINMKIKQAEQNRADSTSEQVVELYKLMASGNLSQIETTVDLSGVSLDLENAFTLEGGVILDTELRMDPKDLS